MVSLSLIFLELLWIDWKTSRLNTHETQLPEPGIERHPRLSKQVSGVTESPASLRHTRGTLGQQSSEETQLLLRRKKQQMLLDLNFSCL